MTSDREVGEAVQRPVDVWPVGEREAARYRWLRDCATLEDWLEGLCDLSPDELDAEIDRRMTAASGLSAKEETK